MDLSGPGIDIKLKEKKKKKMNLVDGNLIVQEHYTLQVAAHFLIFDALGMDGNIAVQKHSNLSVATISFKCYEF
jgi:hypothetical protein